MNQKLSFGIAIILSLSGCNRGPAEGPENPFDAYTSSDSTGLATRDTIGLESFAGLYQQIFAPTCANSGCHDGTFEPDFRSISSSYNTLVYHPVIKNDPGGSFDYRVKPGSPVESVLMLRLLEDIDGQSGIMPLYVDPESDWPENKQTYISAIESWIADGAKDMFGNPAVVGNLQPALLGAFAALPGSSSPLPRDAQSGPMIVPAATSNIELWVAIQDEQIPTDQLHSVELLLSEDINDFSGALRYTCQAVAPKTEIGISGTPVSYYHKASIDLSSLTAGISHFFRIRVQETPQTDPSTNPSAGSLNFIKEYYAFTIE